MNEELKSLSDKIAFAIDPDGWRKTPDPDSEFREYNRMLAQTNEIQKKQARHKARKVLRVIFTEVFDKERIDQMDAHVDSGGKLTEEIAKELLGRVVWLLAALNGLEDQPPSLQGETE